MPRPSRRLVAAPSQVPRDLPRCAVQCRPLSWGLRPCAANAKLWRALAAGYRPILAAPGVGNRCAQPAPLGAGVWPRPDHSFPTTTTTTPLFIHQLGPAPCTRRHFRPRNRISRCKVGGRHAVVTSCPRARALHACGMLGGQLPRSQSGAQEMGDYQANLHINTQPNTTSPSTAFKGHARSCGRCAGGALLVLFGREREERKKWEKF